MAGTRLENEIVGAEAEAVVYSFHATKTLGLADAGMVCCKNKAVDEIIQKRARFGIDFTRAPEGENTTKPWIFDVAYIGENYTGNDVMAAIGKVQLKRLD